MEYDRTPAAKALRRAQRKLKMKEYRKVNRRANREQRKFANKEKSRIEMLKRRELEKKEYYKTEKGQKQYYYDNLEELIKYYKDIVNLFKKDVKSVFESLSSSLLSVYAMNYNFLYIMSGMSALSYGGDSNSISISSNMNHDEIKLSRLNTELQRARKNVYATLTGKHKIGINKEIRTKMLANTMYIPYELADIVNKYI
jgi:hypothetical protein